MRMKLIRTAVCFAALGLAVCTAVDARPPGPPPGGRDSGRDPDSEGPEAGADRLRPLVTTIIAGTISEETSLAERWYSA